MELRQLRYFVTLAEELHFGRAAEREHIVQSALSQQVQRLERELGVRLLERSTHHVALTAAGVVLLAEARQILAHAGRAAQAARLGVLVPTAHHFAGLDGVSVAALAREPLLLAEEAMAPEFNQFTIEMCRAAGFTPAVYPGTVESIRAAGDSGHVRAVVACAQAMSQRLGWLTTTSQTTH
jgi:DNA-binding transcriptional LysR family regulator